MIQTEKHGVFKAQDGWRYRHYGQDHQDGQSAGPYKSRDAAMMALLSCVGFAVEDDTSSPSPADRATRQTQAKNKTR